MPTTSASSARPLSGGARPASHGIPVMHASHVLVVPPLPDVHVYVPRGRSRSAPADTYPPVYPCTELFLGRPRDSTNLFLCHRQAPRAPHAPRDCAVFLQGGRGSTQFQSHPPARTVPQLPPPSALSHSENHRATPPDAVAEGSRRLQSSDARLNSVAGQHIAPKLRTGPWG